MPAHEKIVTEVIEHHHDGQRQEDQDDNLQTDGPLAVRRKTGFGMGVGRHAISSGGFPRYAESGTKRTRSASQTERWAGCPRRRAQSYASDRTAPNKPEPPPANRPAPANGRPGRPAETDSGRRAD